MSDSPSVPVAASDDVRPTPVSDQRLLDTINEHLAGIPEHSIAVVLQVPDGRVLRGALYVNVGNGFSFATWLDHDLHHKAATGYGVAVRKVW